MDNDAEWLTNLKNPYEEVEDKHLNRVLFTILFIICLTPVLIILYNMGYTGFASFLGAIIFISFALCMGDVMRMHELNLEYDRRKAKLIGDIKTNGALASRDKALKYLSIEEMRRNL